MLAKENPQIASPNQNAQISTCSGGGFGRSGRTHYENYESHVYINYIYIYIYICDAPRRGTKTPLNMKRLLGAYLRY